MHKSLSSYFNIIPGLVLSNLISLILFSLPLLIIYNKTENSKNPSRLRLS